MDVKQRFLVVYDYGMGGLWGVMDARSRREIELRYPELTIVEQRPDWMSEERYEELCAEQAHDIDGAPWGILNALIADRGRP
jgi:hypothetical protein